MPRKENQCDKEDEKRMKKSEAKKVRIEGGQLEVEMKMDDVETLRRRFGDTENPAAEKETRS